MNISSRERRALWLLIPAILIAAILNYTVFSDSTSATATAPDASNIAMAEQRASRLRQVAALIPARELVAKQTGLDLADRERGLIAADTVAQAQAALVEIARRVGKGNQLEVRSGELLTPKEFGDYGLVYAGVNFECHIEQLINFLSDLSHQPELVVPSEEHITSGSAKEKTVGVRIVLAGVVAKKLIPVKKALGVF